MMPQHIDDPMPDPELRGAIDALDAPPADQVDWDRLCASIAARAELPLARRRRDRGRSGWIRAAMPTAAAAALAAVVAIGVFTRGGEAPGPNGESALGFHPVVEQVLGVEISEFELDLLFGQVSADMLAVAAVDQR
jgi:hypothetical protein